MKIENLNALWKEFIQAQRLYIIVEGNEEVLDFLQHLSFFNPARKRMDGFYSTKIDACYTGDVDSVRKERFNLSVCEYMYGGEKYHMSWEINSNRDEVYPGHGIGFFFKEFFHFLNTTNNMVENMLDSFDMQNKIEEIICFMEDNEPTIYSNPIK